ncbi:putative dual specificity protein phosphatase [Trypanosoma conorhini]|uniref:protein-tyrosine-phosphatase n=1 Tax=Trypanosoma conorhini TaxID=83891 RepID=A0A3R7MTM0_9TRYP|nr:putative dual specificity protein phosphatase [Trypanosoma conorhini]RNF20505.1 putative dual specificity protein phosphatase [Trypanosoma conorhini]
MGVCISTGKGIDAHDEEKRRETTPEGERTVPHGNNSSAATEILSALPNRNLGLMDPRSYAQLENAIEELCHGQNAALFLAHPELLFSNRAAILCTGEFVPGEIVGKYTVLRALPTGTVGRSFFVRASLEENGGTKGGLVKKTGLSQRDETPTSRASVNNLFAQPIECVFKVITFITRMEVAEHVLQDQKVLTNLIHDNVLRCVDVLDDGSHENLIFVTPYVEKGSCETLAGKIEKDQLLSILHDVAVGLRILHSHEIFHHNLKLDNILIRNNGTACIADAGFGRIFASESAESLVFNGELACMPPEAFLNNTTSSMNLAKVDVWGFGLLMYRLAYGVEPLDVEGKSFEVVRDSVLHGQIEFPSPNWLSETPFQEVVLWCLNRDPRNRPSIMQLLRHPLFGETLLHSIGGGALSTSGRLNANSSGHAGTSLSFSNIGMRYARAQKRAGLTIYAALGKGRNCESFLVNSSRTTTKEVVLKVIRRSVQKKIEDAPDAAEMQRALAFCREARHCSILHLLDIVENKDGCFATQPYADGEFLDRNFPPLTNKEDPSFTLPKMLVDVLNGLHFIHSNGVSNLCLTPTNIFYLKGTGFIFADFGPLFLTQQEALLDRESGYPWYSLPSWVLDDLRAPAQTTRHALDTFCVGLLAASAVPSVYNEAWESFYSADEGDTIVDDVSEEVEKAVGILTRPLVEFILKALTTKSSAKELLSHPYLADVVGASLSQVVKPLELTPDAVKAAVARDFSFREEPRLMDVLGRDPMLESVMLGNLVDSFVEDESRESISAAKDLDLSVRFPFKDKLVCGLCHVDLTIVLFKCLECASYVRCGKCALNDKHADGHEMKPYLIHTIEHKGNGKEAILYPTSSVPNVNVLEEVEMQANLPVGSLVESKLPAASTTTSPLNKLQMQSANKKKVLPKASEMDDLSWEEEIALCSEKGSAELLLYRFDLDTVPKELYDPPLLHVVRLDLSYNNLRSIPHELSFLVKLRSLVISYNQLTELPDSLGNLSQLERLDVSHNRLQQLPQSFMYLQNLATLGMDYNDFAEIPESVIEIVTMSPSMPMLSVIYLAENHRITQFPKREILEKFPKLKLALDNEPNVYETYIRENLDEKLPNVSMMWNKIYPDCIVEHVYCGGLRSAQSQLVYDKLSIQNLLTVGRELVPTPPIGGEHLTLSIDDIEGANIRLTFQESVDFIDQSVKRGRGCLVHCFAGMSRSATTVIAYLMMKRNMRLDEAYCLTKKGRPAIYPNQGFFNQLLLLDAELFPQAPPLNIAAMERDNIPTA